MIGWIEGVGSSCMIIGQGEEAYMSKHFGLWPCSDSGAC